MLAAMAALKAAEEDTPGCQIDAIAIQAITEYR